jgi:hypothetical protein
MFRDFFADDRLILFVCMDFSFFFVTISEPTLACPMLNQFFDFPGNQEGFRELSLATDTARTYSRLHKGSTLQTYLLDLSHATGVTRA